MSYIKEGEVWWYVDQKTGYRCRAGLFICKECGEEFPRYKWLVKDSTKVFCSRKCSNKETARIHKRTRTGENNPCWKGGRNYTDKGYVRVYQPEHPYSDKIHHTVLEHRLVMEQTIGRYLTEEETVHHKNGVRDDNRPDNLELWSGYHPPTQRVEDLVNWAKSILAQYDPLSLISCQEKV